ncbi:MAG TPA: class III lanthionine synthetase LanKC [Catenuloplanes sp.]|jgi:serine/threonine protein kinase
MDQRYETFCVVDPLFYDSPTSTEVVTGTFPMAARPIPSGWARETRDDWLVYGSDGGTLPAQGWKIHVSACLHNAERILDVVADYCLSRGLPFKFLAGPRLLLLRNAKYAARGGSGKFITVYPTDDTQLELVCKELSELLHGEPGPYILSDLRVGDGPVHVRYGGFAARYCVWQGAVVPAIEDPDGVLVPDRRGPVFALPSWVPLPAFLEQHLAARNATTTVDVPYEFERVIHFSNGGGLYVARDRRTGDRVVLKEARPHAGLDATGADALTRLRHERDILTRLAGVAEVPRLLDVISVGEHEFLVLEYLDGVPLNKALVERYPLIDPAADTAAVSAYATWAQGILRRVEHALSAVHARGVVYGDLHLFNVIVRPDDTIALVDFEVATSVDTPGRPALRNQAFAAPPDRRGLDVDRYALACLKLALFLPLTALVRLEPLKAAHLADIIVAQFGVPRAYVDGAVRVINAAQAGASTAPRPRRPRWFRNFTPDPVGWPALRRRLARSILASETPARDDRLFPGDIEQFRSGGLGLAHGAAGVLHALSVTGAGRYPDHEAWLIQRALRRAPGTSCGFYDGLHGVAYTLHELGRREAALQVIEICLSEPWEGLGIDLMSGLAGIGLSLGHLADATGDPTLLQAAWRATDIVATRLADTPADAAPISGGSHPSAGLTHGSSGAALLFLRMYEWTGDTSLLDLAAGALRTDLDRCLVRADGAMEVNEGWRTMPYVSRGSVGIGFVLDRYLTHRPDDRFAEASRAIERAARSPFYAQSGLFAGRAGIVAYLVHAAQHGHPRARAELPIQLRRLAWHVLPYQGGLAFPGDQLLRLSMDLATGTAGVLLALGAALHDEPVHLPFLAPRGQRRRQAPPHPRG